MNQEEKAIMYGQLLNEHTRIGNQISEIKGQSIDLSAQQKNKIKELEGKQLHVMNSLKNLFN